MLKKDENFYTITTFEKCEPSEVFYAEMGDIRLVGFMPSLQMAEETVVNNMCDIYEGCYEYAVIEKVHFGLYSDDFERYFYKFNKEKKRYERIGEPKCLNHLSAFWGA